MYFSKVTVHPKDREAIKILRKIYNNAYHEHQLLWDLFPGNTQDTVRDFLFRREQSANDPTFYLLSQREPYSDKDAINVQTKTYAPSIHTGQRLVFSLRANPVVTVRPEPRAKSRRHDVIMMAKHKRRKAGKDPKNDAGLIREAALPWLLSRAEKAGFCVDPDAVLVDGYQQHRLNKRRHGAEIRYSTVDFTGILSVTDPAKLHDALKIGMGPAKGFGCGLLMIRRGT